MPIDAGPIPNYLLDQAAWSSVEAHAAGRRCYLECPGGPECDQLVWALRVQGRTARDRLWQAAAEQTLVS